MMPPESAQDRLASDATGTAGKPGSDRMSAVSGAIQTEPAVPLSGAISSEVTTPVGGLVTHPGDTATADIDAIRARLDAATPGPWRREHDEYGCAVQGDYGWVTPGPGPEYDSDTDQGRADAEFIAHAPDDIRALLAEVTRLRAELATAVGERDQAQAEVELMRGAIDVIEAERTRGRPFIAIDPAMRSGSPTINHTRLPVDAVTGVLLAGEGIELTMQNYDVTRADILVACWFEGTYVEETT